VFDHFRRSICDYDACFRISRTVIPFKEYQHRRLDYERSARPDPLR